MDKVIIEDLRIETIIGVNEWERHVRQTLRVTIELALDIKSAAASDKLDAAIDYTAVANRMTAFVSAQNVQLLETLAEQMAQVLLAEYPVQEVKLYLRKPAALAQAASAGVQIERSRGK